MADETPTPVSAPEPTKGLALKLDAKTIIIAVLSVAGALGYGGVLPTAASVPPTSPCSDPTFQADVRAALAKQSDSLSDLRERMARVEATVSNVR